MDGTDSGRDAVALGSLLARATGAELMLIAVREEPILAVALPGEANWATSEQQTRRMLAKTHDSMAPDARTVVASDMLIWRGLRHVVRLNHRDLLIVGSARDTEDGRVRLGSSAGELLTHLDCPLAIAPSGMVSREKSHLKRVGVGFDGGSQSRVALDLATAIASAAGAELKIRGALDDTVPGGLTTERITLEGDAIIERQRVSALERDAAGAPATEVPTHVDVRVGIPADILAELGGYVDLLVIGSSGTGRPGTVDLGSTGRALLELAPCPVLVVPRPPKEGA